MRLALFFITAAAVYAQNVPHLAYVLPAGGQKGTTIEIKAGGQFLPNAAEAYISGGGIQVSVAGYERPMTPMQAMQLRDRAQELQKLPTSPAVQKEMADIRGKLLLFNQTRAISPVLAETVILRVVISPDALPGKRELRVASPQGLSNPLTFCVGDAPEVSEQEITEIVPPPQNQPNRVQLRQPATDMSVTLPVVVNGRIKPHAGTAEQQTRNGQAFTPGERDRYRFLAKRGEQLVIAASARDLMPYLADAVPGWFQAVLALYDPSGKEVAYCDDFRFNPDPVIHYEVPADGEYAVEIRDAIYRGREDFVYRVRIGEEPYVTDIFPLGGRAGAATKIDLTGWNLKTKQATADFKAPGVYTVANGRPFQVDSLPESFEKEPDDSATKAQRVKLPIVVNGRIDRPDDWDVFRFEGRAGQAIVAEVYARRLGSPLDSVLKLTDARGKQLAFNDDQDDAGAGLETHHADSRIMATLPAGGSYYLYIGDAQHKGGAEYAYRLRISAPRPDFELRVTPSVINAAGGLSIPITVYAIRRDGFSGPITLALKGAPRGLGLAGGGVPAGQDQVKMTVAFPRQTQMLLEPLSLTLEGRANIDGHDVTHAATPAENMMQAFFYTHLVPVGDWKAAIRRGAILRGAIRVSAPTPLRIPAGGTARFEVQVPIPQNNQITNVSYELSDPPEGVTLAGALPGPNGTEILLQCDATKAKPGLRGNLIINISAERRPPAGAAAQANRQRVPLGAIPAIPFEIGPAAVR
jgi:hypothetical protein